MYINFKIMKTRGITFEDVMLLQIAKQARTEDMSSVIKDRYIASWNLVENLVHKEYLTIIKGNAKQEVYHKVRTTKKGNDLLSDIETPGINEDDLKIFDWMKDLYKSMGKELGNQKKTKRHIAEFRALSGIDRNNLAKLLQAFVTDNSNMEYNHVLEYAFYKPSTMYEVKFDLDQSRLYKYYLSNEKYFNSIFQDFQV